MVVQSALPQPEIPPVARLRSFHPYLLLLSSVVIVAAVAGLVYAGIVYARAARSALLVFLIPAGLYAAARIFLPIELTADQSEIRWKEPFRSAQVVRRRDVARIEQRVKRNSSYTYFVDPDGKDLLFVGPVFSPAQMESFATSVALPVRNVTAEPPRSTKLDALQERSAAQGNRAYGLMFTGLLALVALGLWIFVAVLVTQYRDSVSAYQTAPTCVGPVPPKQDCRYQTTAVVSNLHSDRSSHPAMTLTFAADVFRSGPMRRADVSLMIQAGPTMEEGQSVPVEIWRRGLVTLVNGTETTSFGIVQSNARSSWILLIGLALMPLSAIAFFVWQWRSKPR
jgi:hypothetical protein